MSDEMEVDERRLQPHKSHERNEEEIGSSARKKSKTAPNDDSTDPRRDSILEKIEKLRAKGFEGISIFKRRHDKKFGEYSQLRVVLDPRGFPIRFKNLSAEIQSEIESDSHEVDVQYLKLLQEMVKSEQMKFNIRSPETSKQFKTLVSKFDLLTKKEIDNCFQDFRFIFKLEEAASQWTSMYHYLLHADNKLMDACSNDAMSFIKKLRMAYPLIVELERILYFIAQKWKIKQKPWIELIEDLRSSVDSINNRFSRRLEYGYTKADYLKLKLEVARKLGIITEKVDGDFLPGHCKVPDVD